MQGKYQEQARILSQEEIAPGIHDLRLETEKIARLAGAGQFVSLYCDDKSRMLPRPISVCGADRESGVLRLVYRTAGAGTAEFARKKAGERIRILGPLGNGFPLGELQGKKVFLIGGGIGIPPMLELAAELQGEKQIILGYRDDHLFLYEDFRRFGPVFAATEDGSFGTQGNVLDAVRENGLHADAACACGPSPMLRALKIYAQENGMECWISLEEKMACGIGACLACVCRSKDVDPHTNVRNKRICREGPVFRAEEVEL